MAVRDDSFIRGTMITSLIFLVLSLVLNFLLYRWGSTGTTEALQAKSQLQTTQNDLRTANDRTLLMKAMMGQGALSAAEFDTLRSSLGGDADMQALLAQFDNDMAYLGPEVDGQNRNYGTIPEYLLNAIRSRNEQYGQARTEATTIRAQSTADVDNARKAQAQAEQVRDTKISELDKANSDFLADRDKMKQQGEQTKDELSKANTTLASTRKAAADEKAKLSQQVGSLQGIVDTQRQELNKIKSDRFENVQGEIAYVVPPGQMVLINLGSADALRVGVQFGVIDVNELNVEQAEIKAHLQVTKILGPHSAQARVLGGPSYADPLVKGDKIYSPFWAPGRPVKIAIAGAIKLNAGSMDDIEKLKGMITMAGAEVGATLSPAGELTGKLDPSVRFLVLGEVADNLTSEGARNKAAAEMNKFRAQAVELGITVLPAWKLIEYLKGLNDEVTTPLTAGSRTSDDFKPTPNPGAASRASNTVNEIPEVLQNQIDGQPRQPR